MASSAQKRAELFQREGRYTEVEIVRHFISETGGEDSTKEYWVELQPVGTNGLRHRMTVGILPNMYDDLQPGRRVMAWLIGQDAVLDFGPKNAGEHARRAFV